MRYLVLLFLLLSVGAYAQPKMYPTDAAIGNFLMSSDIKFSYEIKVKDSSHVIEPYLYGAIPNVFTALPYLIANTTMYKDYGYYFGGGGGVYYKYYFKSKRYLRPYIGIGIGGGAYTTIKEQNDFFYSGSPSDYGTSGAYRPLVYVSNASLVTGFRHSKKRYCLGFEIGYAYNRGYADFGRLGTLEFTSKTGYYRMLRFPLRAQFSFAVDLVKRPKRNK